MNRIPLTVLPSDQHGTAAYCPITVMSIHLLEGVVPLMGSCRFLSGKHFATVGWISCQTSAIYKYKLIINTDV